jgi:hypothetical protein
VRRGRGGGMYRREKGRLQGRRTRSIRKAWAMRYSFAILLLFRCVSAMFAGAAAEEFVFCATAPSSPAIFIPVRTQGNDERLCPGPLFSGPESGPGGWRRGLVTEFFGTWILGTSNSSLVLRN